MYAGISLVLCLVVIALGFFTKKNIGVFAISAALILGRIAGVADNAIIANFPLTLFINLSGILFFFAIADCNGVVQLLAKKVLLKLPRNRRLFPILAMLVSMALACIDAGSYAIFTLAPMITMSIALYLGVDVLMVGLMTIYGASLSCYSPITAMGVVCGNIAAASGYTDIALPLTVYAIMLFTFLGLLMYIIFGGFRGRKIEYEIISEVDAMEAPPFNKNQKIVLVAIAILIVFVMVTGVNPGLTGYAFGIVLLMMNTADEREVFRAVPWGLIMMITGFGMLMGVTKTLGGVDLLANWLSSLVNRYTAAPILSFTSSTMSLFTLAIAGPIPTLTPTVATISASLGGAVKEIEMVMAVYLGGMAATISPLSLGGAIILSSYNTIMKPTPAESNKTFNKLLILAIIGSLAAALVSGTGVYGILG
jgi:hypothetical protein